MADNKTDNAEDTKATEEVKSLTPAELKAMFDSLPSEIQKGLTDFNEAVRAHNLKVDSIKAAEAKDPKLIKAEIFEQNPSNNQKLARLRAEELKLLEAAEKLRTQAYEVIEKDGLMPKELTEAEVTKLKAEVTESTKGLRDQVNAFGMMEGMMPIFKGKLTPHLEEIKTRRGTAKSGGSSASQTGVKRPRFKKILVNGSDQETINGETETVWGEVDGNQKYTLGFALRFLKKKSAAIQWTVKELQDAYFDGKDSQDELPDERKFTMTHVYKDEAGNEHSVNYEITAIK